jgi:surface protein
MDAMFENANAITALDVSSWNTSSLTACPWMFYGLNVSTLDVTNWDVDDVTNMEGMFFRTDITSIDVSNWDTSNVTEMRQLFDECTLLTSITWPSSGSLDTSSATDLRGFFCFTTALPSAAYASMRYWDITQATGTGALGGILTNTVNTLTPGEYNQILATWNAANTSNMTADFALAVATKGGLLDRNAMISRGWTINDNTP